MHVKQSRQGCCAAGMRCWTLLLCLAELTVFCTAASHIVWPLVWRTLGACEAEEGIRINRAVPPRTPAPNRGHAG